MNQKSQNILIIATASVAIIKTEKVVKELQKNHHVQVIVTDRAKKGYLPSNKMATLKEEPDLLTFPTHIKWAKWADLILVVPASANTISKFYHSIADNFALSTLLAARKPIIFVPAMNTYMYDKLVKRNIISNLAKEGHIFIGPVVGKLAEKEIGLGRMVEPLDIAQQVNNYLKASKKLKVLLPYGASKVAIDPIRVLTNNSSGLMGKVLANQLRLAGFVVDSVDISNLTNNDFIDYALQTKWDIFISPAAFADFTFKKEKAKIKKAVSKTLVLEQNIDVISTLKQNFPRKIFLGFKLDQDFANALKKQRQYELDGIIWNHYAAMNNKNTSGIVVIKEKQIPFNNLSKENLAILIVQNLVKLINDNN